MQTATARFAMLQSVQSARFHPISDPFDAVLTDDLVTLFSHEWWSKDRERADVERIIAGSQVCVGAVDTASGNLASFARVITDYVTFAVILDVIVRGDLRGHGLGARLMDEIFRHPRLQDLRGIGLQCEESMKGFYERWGFSDQPGRSVQMKRVFDREHGELPENVALTGAN